MQRSYLSRSSGPAKLMPSGVRIAAIAPRRRASSFRNGMRPSGGSITSDVRRDGLPRSSQCAGGPVPPATGPPACCVRGATNSSRSASSCRSACVCRCANSSAVTYCAFAELRRPLERHAELVVRGEQTGDVGIAPRRAQHSLRGVRPLRDRPFLLRHHPGDRKRDHRDDQRCSRTKRFHVSILHVEHSTFNPLSAFNLPGRASRHRCRIIRSREDGRLHLRLAGDARAREPARRQRTNFGGHSPAADDVAAPSSRLSADGSHAMASSRVVNELLFQVYYRLFLRSGDDGLRRTLRSRGAVSHPSSRSRSDVDVFDVDSFNSAGVDRRC